MRDIAFEGFHSTDIADIAAHYSQGIPAFPARRPLERFLRGIAATPTVDFMAIGTPNAVTFE